MPKSEQHKGYGVLILSDLRFTDVQYCERKNTCMFEEESLNFFTTFQNCLASQIEDNMIDLQYLLVLGDITDSALETEFDKAKDFLDRLVSTYHIPRENVLIIPGNHDISRAEQKRYLLEHKIPKDQAHLHQGSKYQTFTKFYNDFYKECDSIVFDPNSAIIRELVSPDMETVFVGVNTLYKEAFSDDLHYGAINPKISTELRGIHDKYSDKCIIACMHHLIKNGSGNDELKQKYIANWNDVLPVFNREKISVFFSAGNAQPAKGIPLATGKQNDYLMCGSISPSPSLSLPGDSAYVLLKHEKTEQKTSMRILPYKYVNSVSEPYWRLYNIKSETLKEILVNTLTGVSALNSTLNKIEGEDEASNISDQHTTEVQQDDKSFYEIAEEFILDVIKANDLYMLGDFRWDPKGNSISYIMTDYFFDNYACLERVKEYYKKLLDEKCKHTPELIIGYEMNGNIIGPLLAIDKGCDYTYLPAHNRKHTEKEKKLPIKTEGKYSTIVVVLDLIYTKNIIKDVTEKIKKVYPSVEHLYFLSLVEGVKKKGKGITEAGVEAYIEPTVKTGTNKDKETDSETSVNEESDDGEKTKSETNVKEDASEKERTNQDIAEDVVLNKNVDSSVANHTKKISCIEELRKELGVEDLCAYSICQIPMIASSFNVKNCKLFRKQIIPVYQLFTETDTK